MSDVFAAEVTPHSVRVEVEKLLEQMRAQARTLPANVSGSFNRITDQIETLVRTYLEPRLPNPFPGVHLTKTEGRIVARMAVAMGSTVSKDSLLDAMYFDRVKDEPDSKILDIMICKIRGKLRVVNSNYRIETIWGQGYILKDATNAAAA